MKLPPVTSAELPYVLKILRAMAEVNRPAMAHSPALLTVLVKFIRHSNPEAQLLALQVGVYACRQTPATALPWVT